jgi:pyruvate formate-lyase activating enzyme-like uncharacterized protein
VTSVHQKNLKKKKIKFNQNTKKLNFYENNLQNISKLSFYQARQTATTVKVNFQTFKKKKQSKFFNSYLNLEKLGESID